VRVEVIRPDELGENEIVKWREMQRTVPMLDNPFLSPDFTSAVGRVRPRARVAVLLDDQDIFGFLSFERRAGGSAVPIGAVLNDCQGVVHTEGLEWNPTELLRACGLSTLTFDHLVDGQHPMAPYRGAWYRSPIIDLDAGFDWYRAELERRVPTGAPGQPQDSLRGFIRKERRLSRQVGDVRFEYGSPDTSALQKMMAWKSAQYRRTGTFDRFARRWIIDLLHILHSTQNPDFAGLLCTLYAGERLVATDFVLRTASTISEWFPAHDPVQGRNSPGMLIRLRLAECAAQEGIRRIDLGRGGEGYKEFLKTSDHFVSDARLVRPCLTSAGQVGWLNAVQRLRMIVLGHRGLYRAASQVRTRYGVIDAAVRRWVHGGLR
jgi:CelD/BcsL family acetyltransferase involved in cellulose biosynthesis